MKWLIILLFPITLFAQTRQKDALCSTLTLTLTPYCNENGRYVQVTGGTPPYFIRKTTQTNYTEMNPINGLYLFAYAGPDNPLNQGLDGDYLVKDSGPGTCGNLTSFKIWGNYGTLPHVEMHGVNFVQYDLTFNKATIADGATVYMYGNHQYHSGSNPGGTVGGAALIKTGTGDFIIGNGAKITSQCGEMWPGIRINNSDAYQRVIGDGARIEHAETAFEFLNQNAATKLTLSQSTLANNFNGLRIHQGNLLNWSINNSLIYTDEEGLLPPYDDAHNSSLGSDKTFEGNYGIQFVKGNGTATNSLSLTGTTIRNYMVGIDGYGSWFSADNCIFGKIRLAGINSYVSGFTGNPIAINHCSFNLNAADAFTTQRTTLRNDANFVANSNLEPIGTFGIVANNAPFAITGNTTFEGKAGTFDDSKPRVGMYATNGTAIEKSRLKNLDFGLFVDNPNSNVTIKENTFEEITQSVVLSGETTVSNGFPFTLSCNNFKSSTSFSGGRTGLLIGQDVKLFDDRIGGNDQNNTGPPNANYFPRNGSGLNAGPVSGYISIKNESANPINYWRYTNELMGTIFPDVTSGLSNFIGLPPLVPQTFSVNDLNIIAHCAATSNCGLSSFDECEYEVLNSTTCTGGIKWVKACTGGATDNVAWPVARMAVSSGTSTVTAIQNAELKKESALSQSIPNPGRDRITIPYYLAEDAGNTSLQVIEMATGKIVATLTDLSIG